ncbi:MAG TPA: GNAT family N-acetyltransferase [Pseudolabrys sp.]|nr:GNAT family N-acetyltransferase [Pseudolabrys sp.]
MTQATQAAFERHIDTGFPDRAGGVVRSVAGRSPGVRLSYHDDLADVERDWRAFEQGADCTAFQTFDWLSTWHRHIGAREGVKPAIVIGRQDGAILFILPLALAPGRLRRVTWFGEFLSNSSAPLLARDFPQRLSVAQFPELWREIEQLLRQNLHHDLIDLDKIPEKVGGQANPLLALALTPHANDAYLVHLTGTWDEFYAAKRSASWRKTDGKKRRRLAKQGEISFATVTDRAEIERTIDALIAQKKSSYASLGVANMFEWPGYRDFFIDMATDPRRHELVHVSSVSVGSTIVAASFGLTLHGNYDYVLAGYAMGEYEGASPGTIHLQDLMRYFIERGFTTFDFNIGDEPYKREWCDTETKFYDYVSPVTVAGSAVAIVMHVTRVAKRFIKRNPSVWRVMRKARSALASLRGSPR